MDYLSKIGDKTKNAVFHRKPEALLIDARVIASLRAVASRNDAKKARFCFHPSAHDDFHQMIVVLLKGAVDRDHSHPHQEISMMLRGRGRLSFLESNMSSSFVELSPTEVCCAFIPPGQVHHMEVLDEWIAWLEIVPGPFTAASTQFFDLDR